MPHLSQGGVYTDYKMVRKPPELTKLMNDWDGWGVHVPPWSELRRNICFYVDSPFSNGANEEQQIEKKMDERGGKQFNTWCGASNLTMRFVLQSLDSSLAIDLDPQ